MSVGDFHVIEGCPTLSKKESVEYSSISGVIDTSDKALLILIAKTVKLGLRFSHLMKVFLEVPWLHPKFGRFGVQYLSAIVVISLSYLPSNLFVLVLL